jgi:uncharacterized membrane protein affecting hemolysin expression
MPLAKFRETAGSAVVEFIVFVLLGQMLVFSGGMQLAQWMDEKLKIELLSHQMARAMALGKGDRLLPELQQDYNLTEVQISELACGESLVCVSASSANLSSRGLSIRR